LEVDDAGRPGMFRARTHDIVPVHELPLAVPAIQEAGILGLEWNPGDRLRVVAPSGEPGEAYVLSHTSPGGPRWVTERVVAAAPDDGPEPWSMTYRVQTGGFWQMHRASPAVLVTAALSGIGEAVDGDWWRRAARPGAGRTGHVETPMTGLTVWDLYSGAGLFSVPLARLVGESGHVEAVEADRGGAEAARRNLAAYGWARSRRAKVEAALPALPRPDIVLLDPPRTGAGTKVCRALADAGPRVIGYVACDPAALARDLAVLTGAGYRIRTLRGFDLFPHTHHVECVAVLAR
jgi:tRNA/tmRNA/rRNA uracil-C5-methylase (TrmA/RlmC/RlmD family)